MSIVHEYFLFSPSEFANRAITATAQWLADPVAGFEQIRAQAIETYSAKPDVQCLMDEYGSWTSSDLQSQLFGIDAGGEEDLALCLLILVYDCFQFSKTDRYYVGSHFFSDFGRCAEKAGWSANEWDLLSEGRRFGSLIEAELNTKRLSPPQFEKAQHVWNMIRTLTIIGSVGWLSVQDVSMMRRKLADPRTETVASSLDSSHQETSAYFASEIASLANFFRIAEAKQLGACINIAG